MKVQCLSQNHVIMHDGELFNVNNLYNERNEEQPEDYQDRGLLTQTNKWIDTFHPDNYKTLTLDEEDLRWMKKCLYSIGCITRQFSHLYDDELEATCKKHQDNFPEGGPWFIRSEPVSLKEGEHGVGPYTNLKEIIESMVSVGMGHTCFKPDSSECKLYFMEWREIHPDKEFRIFVYQNKITAISTQHYPVINTWIQEMRQKDLETGRTDFLNMVQKIVDYFDSHIKTPLSYLENYTMDLALTGDDENPYFIEPNGFGGDYPAGSALFHWYYDGDTLEDSSEIEFRYVGEE